MAEIRFSAIGVGDFEKRALAEQATRHAEE
jgi:hypothetical protein